MSNQFKVPEDSSGGDETNKEEEESLMKLQEMGFAEKQIRETANEIGININKQTVGVLANQLLGGSQADLGTSGTRYHRRPVQIISLDPENQTSYQINQEEIRRIFGHPDVANTAISIYSVAGAFRKGKSFILNLFLRYLYADKKNKDKSWLDSKEDELNQGFGWRGGQERHTQGIWMWNEPFFKETPNGRVAIFLMDTQGSFDPKSPMASCAVIFALSTLISSVQIYNVSQQVQEDSLQHLQLFTDYGKLAQSKQKDRHEKPFQKLMFLVRDWPDPDFSYDFDGGQKYLNEVFQMQPKHKHKDLSSVRDNIIQSFEDVSCCLMPYPGNKVAVRGAKQGNNLKLKDIDTEFLNTADILVHKLFTNQNLVQKRINGKTVTGNDVMNYFLAYFGVFGSGELPEIGTIMQATAKANILSIIKECNDSYRADMNEACKTYLCDKDLETVHTQVKNRVVESFNKKPKFGNKKFITTHLKYLEDGLEHDFRVIYKQSNIVMLEHIKLRCRESVDAAKKMYKAEFEEASSEPYTKEGLLPNIKQKCSEDVLNTYNQKTSQFPQVIGAGYRDDLMLWMEQEYQQYKKLNSHKREELRRKLVELSFQVLSKYERQMDKNCLNLLRRDEFDQAHLNAQTVSLQQFDAITCGKNTEEMESQRKHLMDHINNDRQKYFETNEQKKKLEESKILNAFHAAVDSYRTSMQTATTGSYLSKEFLTKAHQEYLTCAGSMFQRATTQIPQDEIIPQLEELNKFAETEFLKFASDNDRKGKAVIGEKNIHMRKVVTEFQKTMNGKTKEYLDDEKLKLLYKHEESETIRAFVESNNDLLKKDLDSLKKKLESDLKDYYLVLSEKNHDLKKTMKIKADMILMESKAKYSQLMKRICEEGYLDENALDQAHVKSKEEADKNMFLVKKDMAPFAEHCTTQFDEFISREFGSFKQLNKRHKTDAIIRLEGKKYEVFIQYMKQIDKDTESYNDNLKTLHETAKSKSLKDFGNGDNSPIDEFNHLKAKLTNDIGDHYQVACRRNEDHKKRLRDDAEMTLQKAKQEYSKNMDAECRAEIHTNSRLEEIHKKHLKNTKEKFDSLREVCPSMADDFQNRCEEEILVVYNSFKKQNDANLKMLVVGAGTSLGVIGGAAAGAAVGSFLGPIGTGVGAVVGGVGGGVAAYYAGKKWL